MPSPYAVSYCIVAHCIESYPLRKHILCSSLYSYPMLRNAVTINNGEFILIIFKLFLCLSGFTYFCEKYHIKHFKVMKRLKIQNALGTPISIMLLTLVVLLSGCSSNSDEMQELEKGLTSQAYNPSLTTRGDIATPLAMEVETVIYDGKPIVSTQKNQKVLLSDVASGGYGYGVYICDIATVYVDLSIPNPNAVIIKGVNDNRCGFYGNSASNNILRGTTVNDRLAADGTKQRVLTYCYYVRYSASGLTINKWMPCSPDVAKIIYSKYF